MLNPSNRESGIGDGTLGRSSSRSAEQSAEATKRAGFNQGHESTEEVPCQHVDAAWEQMRRDGWNLAEFLKAAEADGDDVRRERNSDDDLQELSDAEELLPCGCCLCEGPLSESEAVHTVKGMAHEECAEKQWPFDPYRDLGIPRGEL